ncbi:MAG: hypothetical protein KBA28_12895 [Syntrophaceae bacterium]|jgi:hypothetical protein|nr:hypothetical protein [Syntrophaceae bacterium]
MVQNKTDITMDSAGKDGGHSHTCPVIRDLIIRPPFRKLRLGLAGLSLLLAAPLAWLILANQGGQSPELLLSFSVIFTGGIVLGFLERVIIFSSQRPEATVSWQLFGHFSFLIRNHGLEGTDRIKVGMIKLAIAPDSSTAFVADEAYPVWCMKGQEALLTVIGYPPEKPRNSRFFFYTTPMINAAMFEDQAQHVGARVARALNLPLEIENLGKTYEPADIPPEWFDETRVRARLKWRRL